VIDAVENVNAKRKNKMSTWSSRIGKFKKKDPDHGWLWKKIKNFFSIKFINICNYKK